MDPKSWSVTLRWAERLAMAKQSSLLGQLASYKEKEGL
jgi:hypothetical protein